MSTFPIYPFGSCCKVCPHRAWSNKICLLVFFFFLPWLFWLWTQLESDNQKVGVQPRRIMMNTYYPGVWRLASGGHDFQGVYQRRTLANEKALDFLIHNASFSQFNNHHLYFSISFDIMHQYTTIPYKWKHTW